MFTDTLKSPVVVLMEQDAEVAVAATSTFVPVDIRYGCDASRILLSLRNTHSDIQVCAYACRPFGFKMAVFKSRSPEIVYSI